MKLNITDLGSGTRPLVFVHGLFGQGRNFHGIARTLLERDPELRIGLLDLPNHGRSPWTDTIDYRAMADQVAEALQTWSPDRSVALVGHSMGGRTAMQLALRHPELVERLVVVDISPVAGDRSSSVFASLVSALRKLNLNTLDSRAEAEQRLAPLIPNDAIRSFLLQNLRRDRRQGWHWQCNLDLLERDLDEVAAWPDPPTGAQYLGPVLWVRGALSAYVQPEYRPAMEALFPSTRLMTIKNASHWVHSEQPEVFVDLVDYFLHDRP